MDGMRLYAAALVANGCTTTREDPVATEAPVAVVYNRFPFAVMLATPADLEDFAAGFSLTEEIVGDMGEISGLAVRDVDEGLEVHVDIARERYMAVRERHRRRLVAGSSCGLCGTDSFAEALRPVAPVRSEGCFCASAIHRAISELPARQLLNRQVGAVHAAAFATAEGEIVAVREDVGRHNALDKLIGALARAGIDRSQGFVVVSSRCSYEMTHKTAVAGIPLIASVSAPTSLAITLAESAGVGLAAFAREGRFTLYANSFRIRNVTVTRAAAPPPFP